MSSPGFIFIACSYFMINGPGVINFKLDSSTSVSLSPFLFHLHSFRDLTKVLSLIITPCVSLASDPEDHGVNGKKIVIWKAQHTKIKLFFLFYVILQHMTFFLGKKSVLWCLFFHSGSLEAKNPPSICYWINNVIDQMLVCVILLQVKEL